MVTPKDSTVSTTQPSAFIKRALTLMCPPILALGIIVYFVSLSFFHTGAARNDTYRAFRNGSLSVGPPSVLINDTSPNGDRLTAHLRSTPNHGGLIFFNENGSFLYVPDTNFVGEDSFVYEAINGTFSDTATVTITITPKPIALAH